MALSHLPRLAGDELADRGEQWPIRQRSVLARGRVTTMVRDDIDTPDGAVITREWVHHPGAVAVVALDDDDAVVLVGQYRHPVQHALIELPAGLLDVPDEPPVVAAARELAEEAGVQAETWQVLVDVLSSPGSMAETVRIFLARGLSPAPAPPGFTLEGEERHMTVVTAPLDDLVAAILAGRLQNGLLVSGCLAARVVRDGVGGESLRSPDAPWPARVAGVGAPLDR